MKNKVIAKESRNRSRTNILFRQNKASQRYEIIRSKDYISSIIRVNSDTSNND